MTVNLNGIRFDQIYGDNSGGAEFDTDRDGTTTQEDEFVSFTNASGVAIDVSGYQIYSDSAGSGAPDVAQDGLYHTFPPGTVIQPGETLYIINEITGDPPAWAQEASEGGVESEAGGESTNFLSEGDRGSSPESVALVDPSTGDYIVFNMSSAPNEIATVSGFPGTNQIGEIDGNAIQDDQNAGSSYQFNTTTDEYEYSTVFAPCFVAGTMIQTQFGLRAIQDIRPGDLIETLDHGVQPVLWHGKRVIDLTDPRNDHQRPIYIEGLGVSPQHRILLANNRFAPAKALSDLPNVTRDTTSQMVAYHHLLLPQHNVLFADGLQAESLYLGPMFLKTCQMSDRLKLAALHPTKMKLARPCLTVRQSRRIKHPDPFGLNTRRKHSMPEGGTRVASTRRGYP